MTTILKREEMRNIYDDATIIVEKYLEKDCAVPMWRYYYKYDNHELISGYSDGLWNKPKKSWLIRRF